MLDQLKLHAAIFWQGLNDVLLVIICLFCNISVTLIILEIFMPLSSVDVFFVFLIISGILRHTNHCLYILFSKRIHW